MTTIAERAAAAAGRTAPTAGPAEDAPPAEEFTPAPDPMADYEPGNDDPEQVPVGVAWLRVRRDIRAISKDQLYNQSGTRFNFRGVDAVVNVFGPVTLKHGVNVMSSKVEATYGEKTTKNGGKMRECSVLVTWTIMGPRGDTLTLQTMGEALDTADKATTKAQSVALRTLLLGFGLTPTHDKDPDADRIERGEAPVRSAVQYLDEITHPQTSAGRLRQIHYELRQTNQLGALLTNEVGDEERAGDMVVRIGKERAAGGAQ
ncbi:ERF family protein [Streptomyces griseoviridis]|uniref:ERF family protein n=1 Tax=Streptomyces griseoviridis TaxID=45398 RepID=UPI0033E3EF9D